MIVHALHVILNSNIMAQSDDRKTGIADGGKISLKYKISEQTYETGERRISVAAPSEYHVALQDKTTRSSIGMVLELINAIAVIGIALLLYPIFKEYNQSISLGDFGLRIIEPAFFAGALLHLIFLGIWLIIKGFNTKM